MNDALELNLLLGIVMLFSEASFELSPPVVDVSMSSEVFWSSWSKTSVGLGAKTEQVTTAL